MEVHEYLKYAMRILRETLVLLKPKQNIHDNKHTPEEVIARNSSGWCISNALQRFKINIKNKKD